MLGGTIGWATERRVGHPSPHAPRRAQVRENNLRLLRSMFPSLIPDPAVTDEWSVDGLVPFWKANSIMADHRLQAFYECFDQRGFLWHPDLARSVELIGEVGAPATLWLQGLQHYMVSFAAAWVPPPGRERVHESTSPRVHATKRPHVRASTRPRVHGAPRSKDQGTRGLRDARTRGPGDSGASSVASSIGIVRA